MQTLFIFCVALVYLSMAVGAVGSFLPIVPGPLIAFTGILGFKLIFPESMSWDCVVFSGILTIIAQVLDFALGWLGAKKFGATWRGCVGAFIGLVAGMFVPPQLIWIFLGPFVGAFIGEYAGGAGFKKSGIAGFGAFAGNILASVLKFVMIVAMGVWFGFALK